MATPASRSTRRTSATQHLVGKTAILPLVGREMPIVADDYVELDFGTGCVKMTPCHDPNDFEVGQRHNLEQILIFDEDAPRHQTAASTTAWTATRRARPLWPISRRRATSSRSSRYNHNVGTCYRCGTTVEPMTIPPVVREDEAAGRARHRGRARTASIKFVPERFAKTYHQLDGECARLVHLPPALVGPPASRPGTATTAAHVTVSARTDVCEVRGLPQQNIHRDHDVLDTWFSSALWPFSTLGWPDKTPRIWSYFYPTSVLVTGYDIIFFWVARMIFSGLEQMDRTARSTTVFIHGLVRDEQGRKMSKSLGNGIDPLEMIDKYGADALRFNLITGNSPGNDMRFYVEKVRAPCATLPTSSGTLPALC